MSRPQSYVFILFIIVISLKPGSILAQGKKGEITVFAGTGMRVPLDEIGRRFEEHHGVKVIYDYEGSGRLGNKILVGQMPDIFIPGSEKWAKILKNKGYVEGYTPMAVHTPVIITPMGNEKVQSINDFIHKEIKIALGDAQATAIGGAASCIFQKAGLEESAMNIIAFGVSVKQLVLWVEKKNADASIVWHADAIQSDKVNLIHIPKHFNCVKIIPICRMVKAKAWSSEYMSYCLSNEGQEIFTKHGFEVVN